MTRWRDSILGYEIELAHGKSLPAHSREHGSIEVFGSNGCVGHHTEPLTKGPGIVIGRKGSVGEVVFSPKDFWPIDTTYYVVNKGGHDWRFLFHLLSDLGLTKLNSHSAVPGLNREDVYSISVKLPPRSEREEIAAAIDAVQRSLELEADSIDQTQVLKRAAMQTLFTRGLRGEPQKETEIGPVPESWETATVAEAVRPFRFERAKQIPKSAYGNSGRWPIVDQGQEFISGFIDDEKKIIRSEQPLIIFGDHTRTFKFVDFEFALGADGTKPLVASDGFDPKYLYYALCNLEVPARGYNRHYTVLSEMGVGKPGPDEQREIVAALKAIDRKIDLHRRKRAVLDELSKALLHKLMAGEIRVGDLDLSVLAKDGAKSTVTGKEVSPNPAEAVV
jgi:type I restriction enzyme, S subunit